MRLKRITVFEERADFEISLKAGLGEGLQDILLIDSGEIYFENKYLISKKDLLENAVLLRIVSKEKPIGEAEKVMPTLNDAYLNLVG